MSLYDLTFDVGALGFAFGNEVQGEPKLLHCRFDPVEAFKLLCRLTGPKPFARAATFEQAGQTPNIWATSRTENIFVMGNSPFNRGRNRWWWGRRLQRWTEQTERTALLP